MLNFTSVNEVDDKELALNVYNRLGNLVWCIRNRKYYEQYNNNFGTIIKELMSFIKPEHEGLLNNIFLLFIFRECNGDPSKMWKEYIKEIKKFCCRDKYMAIYRYLHVVVFYCNWNESIFLPGDMYYNEGYLNYKQIFEKVITKPQEKTIFNGLFDEITNLRKLVKIGKENNSFSNEEFYVAAKVLTVIASYCLVTQDYDSFEVMVNNFNENRNTLLSSMVLNGIGDLMNEENDDGLDKDVIKNNIKKRLELIHYIIETLSNKNNNEIHRVIK